MSRSLYCSKSLNPDVQAALVAAKTDKASMTKAMKKSDALLKEMVALTLRPDLTRNQRTNLETCVTVHMHQKETTGMLCPRLCLFTGLARTRALGLNRLI